MAKALTARALQTIKPDKARREIPDGLLRGLFFIVQPSGMKSWAIRYRHGRRTRKHTLGAYPAIDLKSARELSAKALRAVAEGRDPGHEKAQVRNAKLDTVEGAVAQFIERRKQANRPRTIQSTELLLRLHVLPRWRGRAVASITRRDVLDMVDRVIDAGTPIAANRALTATKTFFNWCVGRDIIAASPCTGVKPPTAERARDRILTDNELSLVWHAAEEIGWPYGPLVQMLIVTGQRRDEVAKMQWSEIDLTERLWTLPRERAKNDRPHSVPLSPLATSVLKKSVPRIAGPYVFTTNGETASSGYSHAKRRLDAQLPKEMPAWRWHDLRRTLASGMARLGVNLPTIEKVLNHVSGSFGGIVSVYQHHDFADEKRKALEAWSAHIEKLISGKAADKVVSIRGQR
jgi:integrase